MWSWSDGAHRSLCCFFLVMSQLSALLWGEVFHVCRLVRQQQLSDSGCWQGVVPDQRVWPDTFCCHTEPWAHCWPQSCLRLLVDVLWLSRFMTAWMICLIWHNMQGLLLHVYPSFFDWASISWLSNFTAKQTVICEPLHSHSWVIFLLSFLKYAIWSSLREIFRSGWRINSKHSLKLSCFERNMSDDYHYGNLLVFSVWSWHLNRSRCELICGGSECYKCMRWVIRKSFNYRDRIWHKSCRLQAGYITK